MFQEQNQKTLEILKKHKENVTSIINDKNLVLIRD